MRMAGRHRDFFPIVLGVLALVAGYGVTNDQFIVMLASNHFTVYLPHYFPFGSVRVQALCFGLLAGAPGLGWGILLYWAGHYGPGPVLGRRATLLVAGAVLLVTGASAWGLGRAAAATNLPLYPTYFYPDTDGNLVVTQTVQLTNYWLGTLGATLSVIAVQAWRILRAPPAEPVS
jgi:hypothetical protein